jgi:hypothetical protein
MKKTSSIKFALSHIKTEQFALLEENFSPKKPINLGTGLQFKIDTEKHAIGSFVGVTFEQGKKSFLKIEISCHFKIEEESWKNLINPKTSLINFPKDFLTHIAILTFGTLRGVLFAKTEGTDFNKFILPAMDVASMIEKDEIFSLKGDNE